MTDALKRDATSRATPLTDEARDRCRECGLEFVDISTAKEIEQKLSAPSETPANTLSPFQGRVAPFMEHCFGPEISADTVERYYRFIEESLELAQALGCSAQDAHMLVDYTFNRPVGVAGQEVGGVMVTLAALCLAAGLDMHATGEAELRRVWGMIDVIREKQKKKPKGSPLPQSAPSATRELTEAREIATKYEDRYFGLLTMCHALLDRDITYDGRNAVLPFESHDQAMNHIAEARRKVGKP